MAATEHIERQVAVAAIVAVVEPALLIAMDEIVGGIEIEYDLLGRLRMCLEEDIDQKRLDRLGNMPDPVIPLRSTGRRMFQSRALPIYSERVWF